MPELNIAIDAMGGDNGPSIVIEALKRAVSSYPTTHFTVFGHNDQVVPLLKQFQLNDIKNVSFVHAEQTILMDDKPGQSLRNKPKSSMRLALQSLADEQCDAMVCGGNTGALMTNAYFTVKTLPGVLRPALMTAIPNRLGDKSFLLDLGANASCDSDTLFQFGVMGAVAAEHLLRVEKPKISLLNMGEEEIKGSDVVRNAAARLAQCNGLNYNGFIEGNLLFSGRSDVIVCDGFVGNIALKSCEGLATLIIEQMRETLNSHWLYRFFFKFLQRRTHKSWDRLKPDHYNGASLIGLRHVVIKSHGSANAEAFYSAIQQAVAEAHEQLPDQIKNRVEAVLSEQP